MKKLNYNNQWHKASFLYYNYLALSIFRENKNFWRK